MSLMKVLNEAERRIARAAERRRLASRSRMAERLSSLDQLRGIACHCPQGLAFHHVHSEAIREAERVVSRSKNFPEASELLANACEQRGDATRAVRVH